VARRLSWRVATAVAQSISSALTVTVRFNRPLAGADSMQRQIERQPSWLGRLAGPLIGLAEFLPIPYAKAGASLASLAKELVEWNQEKASLSEALERIRLLVGHVRTARRFQELGLLPRETFWELVFTGETMPSGPAPTIPALQAFLAEIPAGAPWVAMCAGGDALPLAAWAITLGGHVALGLGDYHYDRFGAPHHGELVAEVARLARTLGRPVATPDQARETLGLRPRSDLPKRRTPPAAPQRASDGE
jgi:hypothetical protein